MDPSSSSGVAPRNMAAIDMALDDVIMTKSKGKNHQKNKTVKRTGNTGSVAKPHQFKVSGRPSSSSSRPSSARTVEAASGQGRSLRISVDASRVHSRLADAANGGRPQSSIKVSNLHHEVSEADLIELFGTVGKVMKAQLEYDRSGRSNGTATVLFGGRTEAVAASDRFHNIPLDGLPMRIAVVEVPRHNYGSGRPESDRVDRWGHDMYQSSPGRDPQRGHRGDRRGPSGSRRGADRGGENRSERKGKDVSAEMLDNDLDSYMMQKD